MKTLVTGSSGFIGANVCQRLASAGHAVVPFDVADGYSILDVNCVDEALSQGIGVVYHIAAQADLTKIINLDDGCRAVQLNVVGTHNIARACAKHGAWLIYVSTCCIYGNQSVFPTHEDASLPNPSELYAFTKLAGEEIVRGYGANFSLAHTILRVSTAYGPGMRPTMATYVFFNQAYRGSDITVHGTGKQTRAQIYVDDLVDGIVSIPDHSDAKGQIINLAGSESISALRMANDIRSLVNSSSKIVHVDDRPNQIWREEISVEKAEKLLKWRPRTPWADGLKKTADWLEGIRGGCCLQRATSI